MKAIVERSFAVSGFAIIEVMISLFVISIALISHTQVMGKSMSYSSQTAQMTQAGILASEIAEKIVNNNVPETSEQPSTIDIYQHGGASSAQGCTQHGTVCSYQDLAQSQRDEWFANVAALLPTEGHLPEIQYVGASKSLLIRIFWDPDGKQRTEKDCTEGETQLYCHQVIVRL